MLEGGATAVQADDDDGRPDDDLTVTGIDDEQHPHDLSLAAVELVMVRASPHVETEGGASRQSAARRF